MNIQKNKNNTNFNELLKLIRTSKQKAYTQINSTLIELYWNIGKYISTKTIKENWGKGVVKELAIFIKQQDPTIKGFSDKNLWRMKQFYEMYYKNEKLSSVMRELPQDTNNVFRDSYSLEFLNISDKHKEKNLQKELVSSLKEFILELGIGFAFIGEEYRLQVGDDDFYIDLLFYHRDLKCLVAFELKTGKFKPSHLGQLEFYLEALDRDVKRDDENPSIGILLCRKKNDEVVKYALSRSLSPTVVSEYKTKLIPKKILQDKMNELYALLESENESTN